MLFCPSPLCESTVSNHAHSKVPKNCVTYIINNRFATPYKMTQKTVIYPENISQGENHENITSWLSRCEPQMRRWGKCQAKDVKRCKQELTCWLESYCWLLLDGSVFGGYNQTKLLSSDPFLENSDGVISSGCLLCLPFWFSENIVNQSHQDLREGHRNFGLYGYVEM